MQLHSGENITFWNCLFQLFAVDFDRPLPCPGCRQTCKTYYLFRPKQEYLSNSNSQPPTWPSPFAKLTRCQIVQNSPIVQPLILCCLSIQAAATSFLLLEYAIGGKSPQRPPSQNTLKVLLSGDLCAKVTTNQCAEDVKLLSGFSYKFQMNVWELANFGR